MLSRVKIADWSVLISDTVTMTRLDDIVTSLWSTRMTKRRKRRIMIRG